MSAKHHGKRHSARNAPSGRAEPPGNDERDGVSGDAPDASLRPEPPVGDAQVEGRAPQATANMGTVAARVLWMIIGPFSLLLLGYSILHTGGGWTTLQDYAFVTMLAVTIAARWLEQRSGNAVTADGEISTWNDFRRYALVVSCLGLMAWIAANLLGNYLLGSSPSRP